MVVLRSAGLGLAIAAGTALAALLVALIAVPKPAPARALLVVAAVLMIWLLVRGKRARLLGTVGVLVVGVLLLLAPPMVGLVIQTGSMTAMGMPAGSYAVVRELAAAETLGLKPGDVVTYQVRPDDPTVVTHRIVGTGVDLNGEPRYRLQGDSNPDPDSDLVRPVQVRAKLAYWVPWVGMAAAVPADARNALLVGTAGALLGVPAFVAHARRRRVRRSQAETA